MFDRLSAGMTEFVVLSLLFGTLSIAAHGWRRLKPSARLIRNWRVNGAYFAFDLIITAPVLIVVADAIKQALDARGGLISPESYMHLPGWSIALLAVMLSDFVGYWRHRLMHSTALWPIHAAHHSDEDLTWFSLIRFHPINRLVAVGLDAVVLTALGMPIWAVIFSNRVRHYYGYFVHSDLNWRYGPLKYVFVSPFLHRWHHATEVEARDTNFATVFSAYDWIFGTFYCPQNSATNLGVDGVDYPASFIGQLWYPFQAWGRRMFRVAEPREPNIS